MWRISDWSSDVCSSDLADRAVVHQQLQLAVRAAQQGGDGISLRIERGVAIDLAEAGAHRLEGGEQLLELEVACVEFQPAAHRHAAAVEGDVDDRKGGV